MTLSRTSDKPWQLRAACQGSGELFDEAALGGKRGANSPARVEARKICRSCEVIQECLDDALANEVATDFKSDSGFRAGTVKRERKKALKKRR